MSTTLTDRDTKPWYKHGWPWFLMLFPAIAVVAGTITLVIAVRTFDGMVVDDYQKEGRAIVQTLGRAEHARELGLIARLQVRSESVRIDLSAADRASLPEGVVLTVVHPTRDGFDQVVRMTGGDGVFEARLAPLSTGRWLFQLEDESRSWRMNGAAYLPTESDIRIDYSGS
ncbi:MAG: FixH family protein [Thauera phenolivorans]|uniref:FixH family protein n=1 Tax=Thauera phenolivorans TaxID=1792543 RepID=A0A7X7LWX4_9RHOO|nr:FixH family protein [Thauera phenolivorans]NLF54874.1 FixH family protein [Thauera phenolivorans]